MANVYKMVEHHFQEKTNTYPNLGAIPLSAASLSNDRQFRLNKVNELEIILLLRLKKEK